MNKTGLGYFVLYIFLTALFSFLFQANGLYAQCGAPAASAACSGTQLTNASSTTTSDSYYIGHVGSPTAFPTRTYKSTTYRRYSSSIQASSGRFLRICGTNMELTSSNLNIVVEANAQLLLSPTSTLSSSSITNYGIIQIDSTQSPFAMSNSATIINKGIIDFNNADLNLAGTIINYGLIINVKNLSVIQNTGNICVSANSILFSKTLANGSASTVFTSHNDGPGCVSVSNTISNSANRCLGASGTAGSNANLQFCYKSSTDLTGMTGTGCGTTGFGTGMSGQCTPENSASCNYPLPVTLLRFDAFKSEIGVRLQWGVVNQVDVAYYEILRSGNGWDWTSIGTAVAKDYGNGVLQYSLSDLEPLIGNNYYKLVEVGLDGTRKEYSVAHYFQGNPEETYFNVSPNPAVGDFQVEVRGPFPQYQLEILDVTGKMVFKTIVFSGKNPLENFWAAPALYLLRLKVGMQSITKKILVQ